jgi:hypothetical protein
MSLPNQELSNTGSTVWHHLGSSCSASEVTKGRYECVWNLLQIGKSMGRSAAKSHERDLDLERLRYPRKAGKDMEHPSTIIQSFSPFYQITGTVGTAVRLSTSSRSETPRD